MLPDVAAFTLAPDWICEVVSKSTEQHGRTMRAYSSRVAVSASPGNMRRNQATNAIAPAASWRK